MPTLPRSRASWLGAGLLALLILALPLARGGVDAQVQLAAALLAILAHLLISHGASQLPLAGLALLGVFGVMVLQVLPLQAGHSVSLDPPASARELTKAAAGLGAFMAAWSLGATRRRRNLVLVAFGLAGIGVAAFVLGAALLGLGTLLNPSAPFVNRNHLAGFMNLASFAILGLALRSRGQGRLLWLMAFAAVATVVFLSLSRGGIGAFLVGVGLFVGLAARRERRGGELERRAHWSLAGGLVAVLGVAAFLALEPVIERLATLRGVADEEKIGLWAPGLSMIRDHPLLGIGRGAFETAFPAYKAEPLQLTFTHLENEWLQPLIDLGVPAGLVLIGTLAWIWLAAARRRDLSFVEVGLLAGTGALAAQNVVDFSFEILGVAVPFIVALGLLSRGVRPVAVRWPVVAAGLAGLAVTSVAGMSLWLAHPTDGDALAVARASSAAAAEEAARQASRWHPADYLPVAIAGARWVEEGRCGSAMPWLIRAMTLSPTAPEPHLFLARCLAASGQAALAKREYRLALLYGRADALSEAGRRYPSVEDLSAVAPDTADGLMALGRLLAPARPADAARVLRRVLDEHLDMRAMVPLAHATLAAGDQEEALALARRTSVAQPSNPEGWRLAAAILGEQGRKDAAAEELKRGLAIIPGSPPLVELQVQLSLAARRFGEATRFAEGMASRTPDELALKQVLIANSLAGQGRLTEAIVRAQSATGALPDSPKMLMILSGLCRQAGRFDDAIAAVERAASLPGQDWGAYESRLLELREAKATQLDQRMSDSILKP